MKVVELQRKPLQRRFDLVGNLAKQELLQLQDAAYASRNDDTIRQIGGQLEQAGPPCSCWPARPPWTR
jgi:hypothetical protein